jgi:hypothetical protein
MKTVELEGHVDSQHNLHIELPADIQPGPVKVTVQAMTADDGDGDWRALITQSWAKDWSDPREDIYTLEDGSEPTLFDGGMHDAKQRANQTADRCGLAERCRSYPGDQTSLDRLPGGRPV